ncbi:MAG: AAA family ATPase [Burkholderiales bacterium]|nr:AAA family ATPase [Burkholderiales bacterium]
MRADSPAPRIRLLRDPALVGADGSIKALDRRAAGLLALVAIEPGVTRARAAALLWPESDNARQALRQQIARFRKNYGAELVRGDDALVIADGVSVDVLHSPDGALLGDLSFEDCDDFSAWLAQQRVQRRSGAASGLAQQIAAAEAQGDLDAATRLAEQLLLVDDESEAHYRTLMRLHYLRGDIAQAQAVYERLVRQLKSRFGAQPSAETEALARALRTALAAPAPALPAARPVPVTVLRPPRVIGRTMELAALQAAHAEQRIALVLGEPGLGKTRLLTEFAAGLPGVIQVQGRPGDAGVPYSTLVRLLRAVLARAPEALTQATELPRNALARLLPELAPSVPLPADGQRVLLQAAVQAVLDRAALDAVIVDDLHFADEASCEMLQSVIHADAAFGPRWLLAQRPGEGSPAAARLRNALDEAQLLHPVPLAPLTEDEMADLVDSLGLPELDGRALAPVLVRHTGGNPLYALETLKQGLAQGMVGRSGLDMQRLPHPGSVGALIERRLKQLSERALALARVAAIAGVDFSIALAEEVMGVRALELADAWSELESAQVLRESAFAHDLVYDAALRSIPDAIGRHLHQAVAARLQRDGGEPARIAAHWEAARELARAASAWQQAAERALRASRRDEEARFLESAAAAARALGDVAGEARALLPLASSLVHIDLGQRLQGVLDRLAELPLDDALRQDYQLRRAFAEHSRGDRERTIDWATQALTLASARDDALGRVNAARTLAAGQLAAQRAADALLTLRAVESIETPDPSNPAAVQSDLAWALLANGALHEAERAARAAADAFLALGATANACTAITHECAALARQGRVQAALDAAERGLRLHERIGASGGLRALDYVGSALMLQHLGRHGEALDHYGRALDGLAAPELALRRDRVLLMRGWAYLWVGQPERLRHVLGHASAPLDTLPPLRLLLEAALARAAGRDALPYFEALAQAPAQGGSTLFNHQLLAGIELAAARDDVAALAEYSADCARSAQHGLEILALLRMGERLCARGEAGDALLQAARAQVLLDDGLQPIGVDRGELLLALVRLLDAAGAGAAAKARAQTAADWIRRTAAEQVPPEFRTAFMERHSAHARLLAWRPAGARPPLH